MTFQDQLNHDLDEMAGYPSGGWDLDNYDQFYAWTLHLKKLQPTRSLREAVLLLLDMHARLERVLVPEEAEEESSEDYEPVSSAVARPFVPFQPPADNPSQTLPRPPTLTQSPVPAGRTRSSDPRGDSVPNPAPAVASSSSGGPRIKSKPAPELVSSPDPVSLWLHALALVF